MSIELLTPDTQAIVLLCANFGTAESDDILPLTPTEYGALAQWLLEQQLRPADLLEPAHQSLLVGYQNDKVSPDRLKTLLQRGGAMGLAVEKWTNKGLWIISRSDRHYPRRLKDKLKHTAPPLLYGAGNSHLLNNGGLGLVGSRNAGPAELDFAREVAAICVDCGVPVISGGAKGVDSAAMLTAGTKGGRVVGVLADSLLRAATSKDYRDPLKNGTTVLISPFNPEVGFSIGQAMGRNRYIYTLSDATLVVDSALSGGTWSGATENLKRAWVPLLVRTGPEIAEGNKRLIEMGAHPVTLEDFAPPRDLLQWWASLPAANPPQSSTLELAGLFETIWPHLAQALNRPQSASELAQTLHLYQPQVEAWLIQAEKENKVEQTRGKYQLVSSWPQQLSLLG